MTVKKNKGKTPPPAAEALPVGEPVEKTGRFPIVGLGASAGGLSAFEAFFSGMPADAGTGLAFVLVQHLAPDHKSILTELVGRCTKMRVFEVKDGMKVKPGCVYVIPPNRDMAFIDGALQLFDPAVAHGPRLPIDFFFRSLAEDQGERAVGIVLSGTGSDGTLGLRAIKGEGGLALAQTPETAEYDGMPRSAIATGLVDFVLAPAEMPARLIAYAGRAFEKKASSSSPEEAPGDLLKKIFVLLRSRTGNDFTQYKQNTILRRIERRMAIRQVDSLGGYVKYLQKNQQELDALFGDLLIGVTKFFRDPKEFKALEEALGQLFAGKPEGYTVRAWVPGCSTGEEAYSLAIMMAERLEALRLGLQVQVFATDIDHRSIETARAGVYPAGIAGDLAPERLSRFFTAEPGGMTYRINKNIRDMMVFSEQNVLKDPPFSRLDLVSCRNLLIYLGGELQEKLLPLFHYALNRRGILFLGTAESVGGCEKFFEPLSHKAKLFRRKELAGAGPAQGAARFTLPPTGGGFTAQRAGTPPSPRKSSLRELAEKAILNQRGLAAALTDERGEILYLHGRSGRYLEPAPGEVGMNILKMAREGLRAPLAAALQAAAVKEEPVRHAGLRVKTNGDFSWVNLAVQQVKDTPGPGQRLFLVTLEPSQAPAEARPGVAEAEGTADLDRRVAELQEELRAKEESLEAANAGLADLNEELMSANEELQSANEELQSTNEELSTSTEELQSINEELSTVNAEQQEKVDKLARANNDMINLMASTGIGTIFVDNKLRVQRFTPAAARVVNLIASDEGRPLAHLVSNLVDYSSLMEDTQAVLDTLNPKDIEVRARTGEWFLLRIRPYRTVENVIEGAAITFVEISELKAAQEGAARLAVVLRDACDAVTVLDTDGCLLAWNPAAGKAYGWSESEALAMNIRDLVPEDLREAELDRAKRLSRAEALKPYRTQRIHKDGHIVEARVTATALKNRAGAVYAISTTERVIEEKPKGKG